MPAPPMSSSHVAGHIQDDTDLNRILKSRLITPLRLQCGDEQGEKVRAWRWRRSTGLHRDRFNAPANTLRARSRAVDSLLASLAANSD
jgi:hypothetical protein